MLFVIYLRSFCLVGSLRWAWSDPARPLLKPHLVVLLQKSLSVDWNRRKLQTNRSVLRLGKTSTN